MVRQFFILLIVLLLPVLGFCQNLISYASLNTEEAYIGQPVSLSVSVYTSTWFTSGVDLGNIQVDGALSVYFRSLSNSKTFSGKNYNGVVFYYNVFPTREGEITIPSLTIHVESPKTGGYKGIKHVLKTKPKRLNVRSIPLGYDATNWLVANYLNVNEKWSTSLNNIKVGDVVQRTISRSVGGTLSEFIPATIWDSIYGVSLYPKRPSVKTNKTKTAVSAYRSEAVNYLFEKEGDIVIPAKTYLYWNSRTKKVYKKYIDSLVVSVKPNADLEMLASIKKSLQKEVIEEQAAEEKEFLIFGLSPKVFFKYLISCLLALFILFKLIKWLIPIVRSSYRNYLKSERHAFFELKKAVSKNDYSRFLQKSNVWVKKLNRKYESLEDYARKNNFEDLEQALTKINEAHYKLDKQNNVSSFNLLKTSLINARKHYLEGEKSRANQSLKSKGWLNPTSTD